MSRFGVPLSQDLSATDGLNLRGCSPGAWIFRPLQSSLSTSQGRGSWSCHRASNQGGKPHPGETGRTG
jgi:hypothetical protein